MNTLCTSLRMETDAVLLFTVSLLLLYIKAKGQKRKSHMDAVPSITIERTAECNTSFKCLPLFTASGYLVKGGASVRSYRNVF